MSFHQLRSQYFKNPLAYVSVSAAITGTATASIAETDIVTGGKTIIITLTNGTWEPTAGFDAQRQNIINGLDSDLAEATGWDAVVKAGLAVGAVVRTSDTAVTVTLSAFASYDITATETITVTVPASAISGSVAIIGNPTFTVSQTAGATSIKTWDGLAYASNKTYNGLAQASTKTINGLV